MDSQQTTGRFAPSPTGPLHFGSMVCALASFLEAKTTGGRWIVRIEDIDTERCRREHETSILKTLEAAGLLWDGEVVRQSERTGYYGEILDELSAKGLVYGCCCSRSDLADAPRAIDGAHIYPGTCRFSVPQKEVRAFRFITDDEPVSFTDAFQGVISQKLFSEVGDFVLKRADGVFSYQLAVVADDIAQGVTHVVRGADLLYSTPRQIALYRAISKDVPFYAHVPVAVNAAGEKLSKQTKAAPVGDNLVRTLKDVLRFLGQDVPIDAVTPREIVSYAVKTYRRDRIPQKRTVPAEA